MTHHPHKSTLQLAQFTLCQQRLIQFLPRCLQFRCAQCHPLLQGVIERKHRLFRPLRFGDVIVHRHHLQHSPLHILDRIQNTPNPAGLRRVRIHREGHRRHIHSLTLKR